MSSAAQLAHCPTNQSIAQLANQPTYMARGVDTRTSRTCRHFRTKEGKDQAPPMHDPVEMKIWVRTKFTTLATSMNFWHEVYLLDQRYINARNLPDDATKMEMKKCYVDLVKMELAVIKRAQGVDHEDVERLRDLILQDSRRTCTAMFLHELKNQLWYMDSDKFMRWITQSVGVKEIKLISISNNKPTYQSVAIGDIRWKSGWDSHAVEVDVAKQLALFQFLEK